jgi:hypothetical protein
MFIKSDLQLGTHSIIIEADAVVVPNSAVMGLRKPNPPQGPMVAVSLRGEFEALPPGKASVEVVENPALLQRLRGAMKVGPTGQVFQPRPINATSSARGEASVGIDVVCNGPTPTITPAGMETLWQASLWRADGSEPLPGVVQESAPQLPLAAGVMGGSVRFHVSTRIEPGVYLLRFKPDPEAAEHSAGPEKILGGDMEFEVELKEWPRER